MTPGNLASIADFVTAFNRARHAANNQRAATIAPETFGSAHLPSLVRASGQVEFNGDEVIDAAVASNWEDVSTIRTDWGTSANLALTGVVIPRPCILLTMVSFDLWGQETGTPPDEHYAALTTLWQVVDGDDTNNGQPWIRVLRPFQVGVSGGPSVYPERLLAKSVVITRVTKFDDSAPTLTLDLALRHGVVLPSGGPLWYKLRTGFIGYTAFANLE